MKSSEVRESFLQFFKARGHTIVPSAPLVPKDDPTLLFTNAGMNQFKNIFLGTAPRPHPRVVNSQKCIRVSGKHNDLDEVGKDTYHHTFFEMLGNWSFGDYFKKEAIVWAWELLTGVWKISPALLWATVFEGDRAEGLPADVEAEQLWLAHTGLARDRVLRFGPKDNFWEMGETGPCGPCSEVHLDLGRERCDRLNVPDHTCRVNGDCGRFVELWNLVFIQYNRDQTGKLHELPAKHVDTGAGFERIVAYLQGKISNYDTDLFMPLIDQLAELSGQRYSSRLDSDTDRAFRKVADHTRALVFAIADGVIPSNEERGYVLRKLLRRAVRSAQRLGCHEPILYRLVGALVQTMKGAYPEIAAKENQIALIVKSEEDRFLKTLEAGLGQFEAVVKGKRRIEGRDAFKLYDTYGFPVDLIVEMASERGIEVDEKGFEEAMAGQRLTSRKGAKFAGKAQWNIVRPGTGEFVGYEKPSCDTEVIRWLKSGDLFEIVLDETPFYAEAGGQVGETGRISGDGFTLDVLDTFYSEGMIVHECRPLAGEFKAGPVRAEVEPHHRSESARAHTATHLLQAVLRNVLGEHVRQEGSLVEPGRFRFDFLHFGPLSRNELEQVEKGVYELIIDDIGVEKSWMPIAEARQQGAIALFGEKYGDKVRVVKVGNHSMELCGGIHVNRTGEIGIFKIQAEGSAAAGIRRITALVGQLGFEDVRARYDSWEEISGLAGPDPVKGIKDMLEDKKATVGRFEQLQRRLARHQAQELLARAEKAGPVMFVAGRFTDVDLAGLRLIGDAVNEKAKPVVGLLFGETETKLCYVVFVTREQSKSHNAIELIKVVGRTVGGGGGGRPHLAEGGGGDKTKIDEAIATLREHLCKKS